MNGLVRIMFKRRVNVKSDFLERCISRGDVTKVTVILADYMQTTDYKLLISDKTPYFIKHKISRGFHIRSLESESSSKAYLKLARIKANELISKFRDAG